MHSHFRLAALLAVIVSAMPMAPSSAIAQTREERARAVKGPDAVPSNYRQVITRYFASKGGGGAKVLSAQISRPGLWESPLGLTAPAPIVCVKWTVQGSFGPNGASLIFRFQDGRIYEALNPESVRYAAGVFGVMALKSVTCDKLAYGPFPELARLQRPKR